MEPQKQKKIQLSAGEKISMLKCWITEVDFDNKIIVMQPMRRDIGIRSDIIYRIKNVNNNDILSIGDEVVATEISKKENKWIAKKIFFKEK